MKKNSTARIVAISLACTLVLAPAPSLAIAPILLLMAKQIVKDAAQSMLKDMLLSRLNGLGCKGMAVADALQALDLRKGPGGAGGRMGMFGGGMPGIPPGMPQMPAGMSMSGMPGGLPGMGGMAGMPGMPGGMPMTGTAGEAMARMREMMPAAGQIPAGAGIDPEQMARIMQAMGQPLSPPETIAVIDEMTEVGFLTKAMQTELKECMVLLPAAAPALGMGMAMLKPILPQLRQAREQMNALSPAEQEEIGIAMVQEMKGLPASERKSLLEFLDSGFFPKRTSDAAKAALGPG